MEIPRHLLQRLTTHGQWSSVPVFAVETTLHIKTNKIMKSIYIATTLVSAAFFTSCCPGPLCPSCKIVPPPTGTDRSLDLSAKLAADALTASLGKGEISGNIKGTVKKTYGAVSADDVALYLLLQAADCESRRGNVQAASELRTTAREELLTRRRTPSREVAKVAQDPSKLTQKEEKLLKPSPLSTNIQSLLPAQ